MQTEGAIASWLCILLIYCKKFQFSRNGKTDPTVIQNIVK